MTDRAASGVDRRPPVVLQRLEPTVPLSLLDHTLADLLARALVADLRQFPQLPVDGPQPVHKGLEKLIPKWYQTYTHGLETVGHTTQAAPARPKMVAAGSRRSDRRVTEQC